MFSRRRCPRQPRFSSSNRSSSSRWPGYDVRFPSYERGLEEAYAAVSSSQLHDVLVGLPARAPGLTLLLGEEASSVEATRVQLASGRAARGSTRRRRSWPRRVLGLEVALRIRSSWGSELSL